jgi:signal peptidase I
VSFPRTRSIGWRRAWNYATWLLTAAIVVAWALLLRPTSLGGDATYVVVRGNSMEPAYATGDLLIVRATSAYVVGDAVAYRVPATEIGAGTLVIHRIIGGDPELGFSVRGDSNPGEDPWHPRAADVVGRAYLHVPMLGRVTALLHQPITLAALAAALVVMWVIARPRSVKSDAEGPPQGPEQQPGNSGLRRIYPPDSTSTLDA